MGTITTKDGVEIFYKDWGKGQPIVFSHGWPLSADDWDAQLLFFLGKGYRVIAHDRRGHGRSSQVGDGHDMDHYPDDLAAVTARLDLQNAIHVGHSTGGYNFVALPPGGIPTETFADERSLKINGSSIALKHYGPAHTDSDISVTFPEASVVHLADTFWNGICPFIDYSTGGSIDGMIAASEANLAATNDETIVIAGHGKAVGNKAELREFRDMLAGIRENVAALKKQGRSRDETVAAKPSAAFDAKFGNFVIDPAFFTRLVYEGV